jgi:hypothetical protein
VLRGPRPSGTTTGALIAGVSLAAIEREAIPRTRAQQGGAPVKPSLKDAEDLVAES